LEGVLARPYVVWEERVIWNPSLLLA
jgi:hypothetical protein